MRARLLRRAGDFNGAIDAMAAVVEKSPALVAERMLARYQWQGLLLGNLEEPLLRPKAPEAMTTRPLLLCHQGPSIGTP